jgi:hypothetical protein
MIATTRKGVLSVAVLWAFAGVASAQYFGQNKVRFKDTDFRVLHTAHFDIHYYPEERDAAEMAVLEHPAVRAACGTACHSVRQPAGVSRDDRYPRRDQRRHGRRNGRAQEKGSPTVRRVARRDRPCSRP